MKYKATPDVRSEICTKHWTQSEHHVKFLNVNLLAPELFFKNFSTPVYKMWIIQELNTLELWNKKYFEEEKKTESI